MLVGAVDHPIYPRSAAAWDGRRRPGLPRRCAAVAVAKVAAAVAAPAAGVAGCPSVACAISLRAATSPADSKTRPELVNEKTDEDTGQSLGYRFRLIRSTVRTEHDFLRRGRALFREHVVRRMRGTVMLA